MKKPILRTGGLRGHFTPMLNERYVVSVVGANAGERMPYKSLWEGETPLRLALGSREQLVLERAPGGFHLSVSGHIELITSQRFEVSPEISLEVPATAGNVMVTVRKAAPLRAAYLPEEAAVISAVGAPSPTKLRLSFGYMGHLSGFHALARSMVGRSEGQRVFHLKKTRVGYRLKSFSDNLSLNLGADEFRPVKNKEICLLSAKDLEGLVLLSGVNWWRMNRVALRPLEKVAGDGALSAEASEKLWFRKFNQKLALGCLAIVLAFLLLPHGRESLELDQQVDKPVPTTTIIELKKPKIIEKIVLARPMAPAPVKQAVVEKSVALKPSPMPKKIDTAAVQAHQEAVAKAQAQAKARSNLAKSLGFLSNAPHDAAAPTAAVASQRADARYKAMAHALPAEANSGETLNQLAKTTPVHGPIQTEGARTMDSHVALSGSKTLNEVQGRVSLSAMSSSGATGGVLSSKGISVAGNGTLAESEIERALSKYLAKFQYCYEKALLTDATLAGNILVQWTIGGQGGVSDAKVVRSQLSNAQLHQCLLTEIVHVHFPVPQGGVVVVQYPFAFSSTPL